MAVTVNVGVVTVDPTTGEVTAMSGLAGAFFSAVVANGLYSPQYPTPGFVVPPPSSLGFVNGIVVLNQHAPFYANQRAQTAALAQAQAQAISDNIS